MANAQIARLSSRSYHLSSRALKTDGRGCARKCKSRGEFFTMTNTAYSQKPSLLTIERTFYTKEGLIRYFSGKGTNAENDYIDIDRTKFTREVKIEMPDVGDDIGGVIEKWHKKEGDLIRRDEVICDIRTELFTFGMLTDDDYDSIMGKILIPEESDPVQPGTVLCTTLDEGLGEEEEIKR
ncbi:hypothetical protein ACHAW5_002054 [Stephanodiscus triporus]|uniref:Lipoyl-binding domain-containing protein n=1 Tax=Stephanodiscus triporus TaxID=2934178 RepID=A0ABD3PFP5_9STRA